MHSDATTVKDHLSCLPDDRRGARRTVRAVIRTNLPTGIVETMSWGMIAYEVPLDVVGGAIAAHPTK